MVLPDSDYDKPWCALNVREEINWSNFHCLAFIKLSFILERASKPRNLYYTHHYLHPICYTKYI